MLSVIALLLATTELPAPAAPLPPLAPPAPIVGGYTEMDPRARELRPVVKIAVAHITPQPRARAKVMEAMRQVVAGTNYRLQLKLRDGSLWRVTVWQQLDGQLKVTEAVRED